MNMHCWNIILRVKSKTKTELNEFKNFVHSDCFPLDFQKIIPISPPILDPSSKIYRPHWGTYYKPTFVKIMKETTKTIKYNFDADEIPTPIFIEIARLFPNIKFYFNVDLDKKYIFGGGMLKGIYRFNCFADKTTFELDDLSSDIYVNKIEKMIDNANNRYPKATKYEIENLFDLIYIYVHYDNIPDKMNFLLKIYPTVFRFPLLQDYLKSEYPSVFRHHIINDLLDL